MHGKPLESRFLEGKLNLSDVENAGITVFLFFSFCEFSGGFLGIFCVVNM